MSGAWPRTMTALITAFARDENIDGSALEHNLSLVVSTATHGVLLAGSTGEGPYLEPGERKFLISAARSAYPNLTILCGIFADTDRQARLQISEAASGGADAVVVATPGTLVRDRQKLITDFYRRIADSSPLPVFLYSVPRVTGQELPVESVSDLAEHPNIIGMKDSGGDVSRLEALSGVLGPEFIVYTGSSRVLVDSARRGAYGAITASANYVQPLVSAAASGDWEAQIALVEITTIVEKHGVPGTKFTASLAGMRPGICRLPLQPLDAETRRSITDTYKDTLAIFDPGV